MNEVNGSTDSQCGVSGPNPTNGLRQISQNSDHRQLKTTNSQPRVAQRGSYLLEGMYRIVGVIKLSLNRSCLGVQVPKVLTPSWFCD